jgi:nickel/cobalt transporter (NicO) family protein
MSVTREANGQATTLLLAFSVVAVVLLTPGVIDAALAQGTPFGAPRGQSAPIPASRLIGWVIAKQNAFYQQFSALIRAGKQDGSAVWTLLGVSFLYGVFHAAGPGHGKAVISSYVVANEETWRRGVVLSFASALLQALVAVVFVGIAAVLLRTTAPTMKAAVDVIEIVSYGLIVAIGLRLLWAKGRALITTARSLGRPGAPVGAAVTHPDLAPAAHDHHGHAHDHHHHAVHDQTHPDDVHDYHRGHDCEDDAAAWGHAHAPEPQELAGPGGWKRGMSAIVAVGMRPCSGAIIVLVFALAQGLFWAGVGATFLMGLGTAVTVAVIATIAVGARASAARFARARTGYGMLAMRGIEVAAALLVTAFGVLLLTGYMASERIVGL